MYLLIFDDVLIRKTSMRTTGDCFSQLSKQQCVLNCRPQHTDVVQQCVRVLCSFYWQISRSAPGWTLYFHTCLTVERYRHICYYYYYYKSLPFVSDLYYHHKIIIIIMARSTSLLWKHGVYMPESVDNFVTYGTDMFWTHQQHNGNQTLQCLQNKQCVIRQLWSSVFHLHQFKYSISQTIVSREFMLGNINTHKRNYRKPYKTTVYKLLQHHFLFPFLFCTLLFF